MKRKIRYDRVIILVLSCILCVELLVGLSRLISYEQNKRLDNTYTTLIRDGEVIELTQRELIDYYKNR